MRNKALMIIALLGIAVGSIGANETTVTYRIKRTDTGNRYKTIMLGPNNTLGYTEADHLHTMRAHFEIDDPTEVKACQLSFGEEGTTGIIPIKAEPAAQGIYTLDGLRLKSIPTRKGIYIKDGKKVLVND